MGEYGKDFDSNNEKKKNEKEWDVTDEGSERIENESEWEPSDEDESNDIEYETMPIKKVKLSPPSEKVKGYFDDLRVCRHKKMKYRQFFRHNYEYKGDKEIGVKEKNELVCRHCGHKIENNLEKICRIKKQQEIKKCIRKQCLVQCISIEFIGPEILKIID